MLFTQSLFFHPVSFFDTSESKSNTPSSLTDIFIYILPSLIVYCFIHSCLAFLLLPQLNQNLKFVQSLIASLIFYPRYIVC